MSGLVFLLFILHAGAANVLNLEEKLGLLNFMKNVRSINWSMDEPACSWKGVTCSPDNSTVVYLRLPARSLIGQIPPKSIGRLTNLRVLSLHTNYLSGEIPSDFSGLTMLTSLRLERNAFSGQIPDIPAEYLTNFNVSFNRLNGCIPYTLAKFPASAFSNNLYLYDSISILNCGRPVMSPRRQVDTELDQTPPENREIVGVSTGSGLLCMILVCSLGKKIYQQMKPASKGSEMLVALSDDDDLGFDLEDLMKTTAEVLGGDGVGTSYKQVLVGKNRTVVVKKLKDVTVTEKEFKSTMEGLGKMMNKSYVVPLRAFYNYSEYEKLLVYDYMPAGSLFARLHGSNGSTRTRLNWDQRMRIALSAAKGLADLHEVEKVVHGNVKSSNIFLQQETNNEVSFSDYGLNTLFRVSSSLNHQVTGYCAPEVLKTHKFTFKTDVYSFGVLLLELLTRKNPNQASFVHFSEWIGSIVFEEPKANLFDVELTRDHYNIEKMVQLLQIAKDCVSIVSTQRPPIRKVMSMMENMTLTQSSDYHSKGNDDRSSMETHDALSTITLATP